MAKKEIDCLQVPELERHELIALQVVADPNENANQEQQALAIKVIIEKICLYDVQPIQFGAPDETGFLNGRVFVGKEIFRQRRKNVGELPSENE